MTQLNSENLFEYLVRLAEAKRSADNELLFKLIVLNNTPGVIHGFTSRITQHDGLLQSISSKLRGKHVFFAGSLLMKTDIEVVLESGGYSLKNTGYIPDLDKKLAVHGLLGMMFKQMKQQRFTLLDL